MSRRAGLRGTITGSWQAHRRYGAIVHVRMGGRAVAELIDYDGDGTVDDVFVPRFLRY